MRGIGPHHSLMGFRTSMANAFLIKHMKNYLYDISVGPSVINTIFSDLYNLLIKMCFC